MHFFGFRADQSSLRYSPVGACCPPSSTGIGGWFGEGSGGAEVNCNRDLVSELHWSDLFWQDPRGTNYGGTGCFQLSSTAVTRKM